MGQRIVRQGGYRRRESLVAGARHWVWLRCHNLTWHRRLPGVRWPGLAWSFMWTRGTFARRFWTVVIIGLAVYAIVDAVTAELIH